MDERELYNFLKNWEADDDEIDRSYTELINATIDYENETGDSQFEYLFEDYVDDYSVAEYVKSLADEGAWSRIRYYLEDADEAGINRVDAYGNLHYVEDRDLNDIRDQILAELGDYEDEDEDEDYE